jgi:hypothetical protein
MPNYKYMFEKTSDIIVAVLDLLNDVNKRKKIVDENYNYWLNNYEFEIVKKKYLIFLANILKS